MMSSSKFLLNFYTYIVLRKLSVGLTPKKIAISLGWRNLSRVMYYIKKLESLGYIRRKYRSSHGTYYELTREGKELLLELHEHHEGQQLQKSSRGVRVRLHGFGLRFPVVRRGVFRWDREWLMRNWLKRYSDFGDLSVEETSRHVIVYVKRLVGSNSWRLYAEAIQLCLRFANYFCRETGYVLGPGEVYRDPEFAVEGDPLAEAVNYNVSVSNGDNVFSVDASPGEREVEFKGPLAPEDVQKYREMPYKVEDILYRLDQLDLRIHRIEEIQSKLVGSVDRIARVFENMFSSLDQPKERGRFYG